MCPLRRIFSISLGDLHMMAIRPRSHNKQNSAQARFLVGERHRKL
jgi:hypothetical protein